MTDDDKFYKLIDDLRTLSGSIGKLTGEISAQRKKDSKPDKAQDTGLDKLATNAAAAGGALETVRRASSNASQAMGRYAYNTGSAAISVLSAGKKISKGSIELVGALNQSGKGMMSSLNGILTGGFLSLFGGGIVAALIGGATKLFDTYQDLAKVGQTFGGNMIEMGRSAGDAALSFDEFSKLLINNSTIAAVLADNSHQAGVSLGAMQKQVRENLVGFGMLSMPIEEIAELTAHYADTLRLQSSTSLRNKDATTNSVTQFAKDINQFSEITGKSRDQIADATLKAMKDVTFAAANISDSQRDAIRRATSFLGSMPGEVGDDLAKMLTQTVGRGAAYLTDMGKKFSEVGASSLNGVIAGLADRAQNGDISDEDFMSAKKQFDQYYEMNKSTLSRMAALGNSSAAETLKMLQQMRGIDADRLKEMHDQAGLTKTWGTFSEIWHKIVGAFQQAFFKAIMPLSDVFGDGFGGVQKGFVDSLEMLGTALGTFITETLTPDRLDAFARWVNYLGENMGPIILEIGAKLRAFGTQIAEVVQNLLNVLRKLHLLSSEDDKAVKDEEDRERAAKAAKDKAVADAASGSTPGQSPPATNAATPPAGAAGGAPVVNGAGTPAPATTTAGATGTTDHATPAPAKAATKPYDPSHPTELSDDAYSKLSIGDKMASMAMRHMEDAMEAAGGSFIATKARRDRINKQRGMAGLSSLDEYERGKAAEAARSNAAPPATPTNPPQQAAPDYAAQRDALIKRRDALDTEMSADRTVFGTTKDNDGKTILSDPTENVNYQRMAVEQLAVLRSIKELTEIHAATAQRALEENKKQTNATNKVAAAAQ